MILESLTSGVETFKAFFKERTVYNFWTNILTGSNKKTKLFLADQEGTPYARQNVPQIKIGKFNILDKLSAIGKRFMKLRTEQDMSMEEFEFAATIGFISSLSNNIAVNKSNSHKTFVETVVQQLETISIVAYIRIEHIKILQQFMLPGNWCYIQHYKPMGGTGRNIATNNLFAKKYHMTSLEIEDEEYANCVRVQCSFAEVLIYETILETVYAGDSTSQTGKSVAKKGEVVSKKDDILRGTVKDANGKEVTVKYNEITTTPK